MMDVNERTSVHPYGKEGKVFSSPNYYLSKTECSSVFPAPVSQAKHLVSPTKPSQEPNAISNLRTQSPEKENLGCWSIGQASDDPLAFESCKSLKKVALLLFFRKSRHFLKEAQKVSGRAQNTHLNSTSQPRANSSGSSHCLPSSLETMSLRDRFFSISPQTITS